MTIGMYFPDTCGDPDGEAQCGHEQAMYIRSLTFEAQPVPETGTMVLLGAALLLRHFRGRLAASRV